LAAPGIFVFGVEKEREEFTQRTQRKSTEKKDKETEKRFGGVGA
jgi:hypothetical protein